MATVVWKRGWEKKVTLGVAVYLSRLPGVRVDVHACGIMQYNQPPYHYYNGEKYRMLEVWAGRANGGGSMGWWLVCRVVCGVVPK